MSRYIPAAGGALRRLTAPEAREAVEALKRLYGLDAGGVVQVTVTPVHRLEAAVGHVLRASGLWVPASGPLLDEGGDWDPAWDGGRSWLGGRSLGSTGGTWSTCKYINKNIL